MSQKTVTILSLAIACLLTLVISTCHKHYAKPSPVHHKVELQEKAHSSLDDAAAVSGVL